MQTHSEVAKLAGMLHRGVVKFPTSLAAISNCLKKKIVFQKA